MCLIISREKTKKSCANASYRTINPMLIAKEITNNAPKMCRRCFIWEHELKTSDRCLDSADNKSQ